VSQPVQPVQPAHPVQPISAVAPLPAAVVRPELTVITGLSGAGRSTVAKCLEDMGWFVVDNLPPALLARMSDLAARTQGGVDKIAVVLDVRGRAFFTDLRASLAELAATGESPRVVFLEASNDALVRRFEAVRRPHPLQFDRRLVDGIEAERSLLRELRASADVVIDTTNLNVHELRSRIRDVFGASSDDPLRLTLVSFGYKYGLPVDADLVVDCRFLPNPHWVDALRPLTGKDPAVRDYVLAQPGAREFLAAYRDLLRLVETGYVREGKRYATLAVGCTGGKHRSVAMAEALAAQLRADGRDVQVVHRDMGRE
jgi:UPF0042 nucleotide-binding protein